MFHTFYAYKEHLSESRLFMIFMLIEFSRKKKNSPDNLIYYTTYSKSVRTNISKLFI